MAIEQIARVLRLPSSACTRRERNVLYHLADVARADGTGIYRGVPELARRAGVCERIVKLAQAALRKRGWLIEERAGGGRRPDGSAKRTIWRLAIPTAQELPNPKAVSRIARFPQSFQQNVHNGDRSITVDGDRSITAYGDRSIIQAPTPTPAAAAPCPVHGSALRPENWIRPAVSTDQGTLPLTQHDDEERDRAARMQRLADVKARVLSVQLPAPRRRRASSES